MTRVKVDSTVMAATRRLFFVYFAVVVSFASCQGEYCERLFTLHTYVLGWEKNESIQRQTTSRTQQADMSCARYAAICLRLHVINSEYRQ